MKLADKHDPAKTLSAVPFFKGEEGTAVAMQLAKDQLLKEHITKVPAVLVCVLGSVLFENEKGQKETLSPSDFIPIEANVKHWVLGLEDSQLILMK